jgi:hypothetical protein
LRLVIRIVVSSARGFPMILSHSSTPPVRILKRYAPHAQQSSNLHAFSVILITILFTLHLIVVISVSRVALKLQLLPIRVATNRVPPL